MNRRTFFAHTGLTAAGLGYAWLDEQTAKAEEIEPNPDAPRLFRDGERIAWMDQRPGDKIVAWVKPKWLRFEWVVRDAPTEHSVIVTEFHHAPPAGTSDARSLFELIQDRRLTLNFGFDWEAKTPSVRIFRNPHASVT